MKGMNTSPRLEESLSYRATYLSVQKYTPRMRATLLRMEKFLQKDVCEVEIIKKPRAIQLRSRCLDYKSHVRA